MQLLKITCWRHNRDVLDSPQVCHSAQAELKQINQNNTNNNNKNNNNNTHTYTKQKRKTNKKQQQQPQRNLSYKVPTWWVRSDPYFLLKPKYDENYRSKITHDVMTV